MAATIASFHNCQPGIDGLKWYIVGLPQHAAGHRPPDSLRIEQRPSADLHTIMAAVTAAMGLIKHAAQAVEQDPTPFNKRQESKEFGNISHTHTYELLSTKSLLT